MVLSNALTGYICTQQSENFEEKVITKKTVDPEKLAKVSPKICSLYLLINIFLQEKERLEKRASKAEKEKKEKDAQLKSRSLMASFFGKAKGGNSNRALPSQDSVTAVAGPSFTQSEFAKTFKPFVVKKDAEIAPVNWFLEVSNRKTKRNVFVRASELGSGSDVIVIDDDDNEIKGEDVEIVDLREVNDVDLDIGSLNAKGLFWLTMLDHF